MPGCRKLSWLTVGALAALVATSAFAQDSPSTTVSGVTVTAPPRPQELSKFVYDYARVTANGTYARWSKPVCPLAAGLKDDDERYFEGRIKQIAEAAGALAGGDRCEPNVVLLFTREPAKAMKQLVNRRFDLFGQHYVADLKKWAAIRAPVVAWHAVDWAPLFGGAHASDFSTVGITAGMSVGAGGVSVGGAPMTFQTNMDISPSRLESPIKDEFTTVILVIDTNQVDGLKPSAVSAYLAMAALGQFNLNAKGDGSTILNLFRDLQAGRTPPSDLTSWDVAYLKGLYASNPLVVGTLQRGQLLTRMERVTTEMAKKAALAR